MSRGQGMMKQGIGIREQGIREDAGELMLSRGMCGRSELQLALMRVALI
jgi:hypothetical protein